MENLQEVPEKPTEVGSSHAAMAAIEQCKLLNVQICNRIKCSECGSHCFKTVAAVAWYIALDRSVAESTGAEEEHVDVGTLVALCGASGMPGLRSHTQPQHKC